MPKDKGASPLAVLVVLVLVCLALAWCDVHYVTHAPDAPRMLYPHS